MMKSDKRITYYLSVMLMMLALSTQLQAQSGVCDTDYTLNFSDAGNDWHDNDVSGTYTVGEQTFSIAIDDDDHILQSTNESNEGLEVRIDPHERDDVLTITYTLSETANSVSFPISDLDKKSGGSDQQEQVCVFGYLGNNPIAIMPMITSLDGSVDISGNCATATTNSTTSGQDESVTVEFSECIDRIVIEYGSGPMAPHDPTASKIYIGEGSGFTSNVCNECDENCTSENVLDFTQAGYNWIDATIGGIYEVGTQTYTVTLVDDDGILETNAEDGPFSAESHEGIKVGINPHSKDDKVVACYGLSEVSNKVYFKIRDLDKKTGVSNQQEQVCVYGTLGDDPTIIAPNLTSFDGSVMISQTADGIPCATGTTNSATSHQEESVFVEFDECIDKIFIVYGSGPMAPDNPTYSNIFIGEEFGFYTGVCGEGCDVTCDANAGTLTPNGGSDVCITGGDGQISATPNDDAVVPADYQVLYVLTSSDDLVIEAVDANPVFVVEESGDYTIHTLVYNPNTLDLGIVELGATTGFDVNALLIQGGGDICASLDVAGAPFSVELPRAGILTADVSAFCTDGSSGTFVSATPAGTLSIPEGYEAIYVLTSSTDLVIEDVSDMPEFTVDDMGRYTIHTLVYNPSILDLNDIEIGVTTGFDVNDLLTQGGGDICGALDVTGAVFNVQDVNAGTLTLDGDDTVCLVNGDEVSATPNGDAIIPNGYQTVFVLTEGSDLVIVDAGDISFDIEESGTYTIHTLVYDPNTLDLNDIELGVTTGFDVNAMLVQGGGDVCAALDVTGARFTAEVLNTGTLTSATSNFCSTGSNVTLTAASGGETSVPDGYNLTYVLTSGNGLIIEDVNTTPEFMVSGVGVYTIHTLIYDTNTLDLTELEFGVSTGFDVNTLLTQGGGEVCGALDVAGASFVIDNPDAGQIAPEITVPICTNAGGAFPLVGIPDDTAIVPPGYQLVYVLTAGTNLVIQRVSFVLPEFMVSDNGTYTIHTLVFNPNTLSLNDDIVLGVTTGDDVDALLVQNGGDICASLDLEGAPFSLVTCFVDNDLDNDGISNIQEGGGVDPSADEDNDGIANYQDPDFGDFIDDNNDGINDKFDKDLDGVADIFDLDSDNDGVADLVEAGGVDADGDGQVDIFVDADGDGWTDNYDTDDNTTPELNDGWGTPLANPDSDGDGSVDAVDLDSDNDGLSDLSEAGGKDLDGDGQLDIIADIDGDGYADSVDTDNNNIEGPSDGGEALPSADLDGDGLIDRIDLDSDGDGLSDLRESIADPILLAVIDALGNGTVSGEDMDNDGIIDGVFDDDMSVFGGSLTIAADSDGDLLPNHLDIDSDGDGIIDIVEGQPTFGFFTPLEGADVDTDNDGINDGLDSNIGFRGGFKVAVLDTEGDGIPDYLDLNSDNDDEPDAIEGFDYNGDGIPETDPQSEGMPGDDDNDGLDGIYDVVTDVFDPTNDDNYANELADSDGGTLERDFRSIFSVNIVVYLSGALIDLDNNGYLFNMRSDLNSRGLLPGQTLLGLGIPTPAGHPYNRAPWNYTGTEGANWTNAQYDQIETYTGSRVVDWVLVSFRRDIASNSRIARFAGLVLEDGRVVFPEEIDLSAESEVYILVEHRNHMAAMTPEPVAVNAGRIFYDFTLGESYVGPDPNNPLGVGQFEAMPGVFALYNSDGEQDLDASQAVNPSYNITGADKTIWQPENGVFNIYQAVDYNMNGDTNGSDIIPFSFLSGVFSVVPR